MLVHGPGLGPWTWADRVAPHLETLGLRCFAPDLHAAWPDPGWTPRNARVPLAHYVERLHAMIAQLPGPRILVGHSMGARIVEGLVARGLHDGAVLVSPAPPAGLRTAARALAARHPAALARALLARRPLLWFGEPGHAEPARVREALLHPGASDALAEQVAACLRDESLAACAGWLRPGPPLPADVPVLLIGGREDPLVTPAALRHAAAGLRAPVRLVPHAGHLPLLGEPGEAVARHIGRWLVQADDRPELEA